MNNIDQKKMDRVSGGAVTAANEVNAANSSVTSSTSVNTDKVGAIPKHRDCRNCSSSVNTVTDVNVNVINGGADTLTVNAAESALEAAAPEASDIALESNTSKGHKLGAENPKHR